MLGIYHQIHAFSFFFFFGGGGMKFVAQLKHNTKHNTLSIGKKNKEFKDL